MIILDRYFDPYLRIYIFKLSSNKTKEINMKMGKNFLSVSICSVLGLSVLTAPTLVQAAKDGVTSQPNIVYIVTDDETIHNISAYGGNTDTPYRDSIANNGIKFTQANAVTTVCSPSRYSLLTGRYYDQNTHPTFMERYPDGQNVNVANDIEMEPENDNLPMTLRNNGYVTGFTGKSHVIHDKFVNTAASWQGPLQQYDFDSDPAKDAEVNAKMKSNQKWWSQEIKTMGFDWAEGVYAANSRELFNKHAAVIHNVEDTTDYAVKFIDQVKDDKKPFFLYFATTFDHGPSPSMIKNGNYPTSLDADPAYTSSGWVDKDFTERRAERQAIKNDPALNDKNNFARANKWWDNQIGRVIKHLKETGQYENTIIVYTADHNQDKGEKGTLYGGGTNVPMFMQWPAKIKKPVVYDHVVSNFDIVPTLLDAASIGEKDMSKRMFEDMRAVSFMPVIDGNTAATRDYVLAKIGNAHMVKTDDWTYVAVRYSESIENNIKAGREYFGQRGELLSQPYYFRHHQLANRGVRSNDNYFARNQLFKHKEDEFNYTNLFSTEKAKAQAKKMQAYMKDALKNSPRPFGEFNADDPKPWMHLTDKIFFPEKQVKIGNMQGKPVKRNIRLEQ